MGDGKPSPMYQLSTYKNRKNIKSIYVVGLNYKSIYRINVNSDGPRICKKKK
jgi:hypothetical protein